MAEIDAGLVQSCLRDVISELVHGPGGPGIWVLDPGGKTSLLNVLNGVPAAQASARPLRDRPGIAGHAAHLRYHLELLNRWAGGENAFAGADWAGSWKTEAVDEKAWMALRRDLRAGADLWLAALEKPRSWDAISLTGALASAAHIAYHLGAIRQLLAVPPSA